MIIEKDLEIEGLMYCMNQSDIIRNGVREHHRPIPSNKNIDEAVKAILHNWLLKLKMYGSEELISWMLLDISTICQNDVESELLCTALAELGLDDSVIGLHVKTESERNNNRAILESRRMDIELLLHSFDYSHMRT